MLKGVGMACVLVGAVEKWNETCAKGHDESSASGDGSWSKPSCGSSSLPFTGWNGSCAVAVRI